MDDEYRRWIETMLQGQRDLEDLEKQRKAESDARVRGAVQETQAACASQGITVKDFLNMLLKG